MSERDAFCFQDDRLTRRMRDLLDRVQALKRTTQLRFEYDSLLPYPSHTLSDKNEFLGSFLYEKTSDVVSWLYNFFDSVTLRGRDNLDYRPDWDMIQISFREQPTVDFRVLGYKPLDYDPRTPWRYQTPSILTESWLHIPLNNLEWMNVCQTTPI